MKSYCDKSTAKRGFIRMGGDAAQFENAAKEVEGKWMVDDAALPKRSIKRRKIRLSARGFPRVDMFRHKTGDALIAHIAAFDRSRKLRSGSAYIIDGKEVCI